MFNLQHRPPWAWEELHRVQSAAQTSLGLGGATQSSVCSIDLPGPGRSYTVFSLQHRPPWAWEELQSVQSAAVCTALEATLDKEAISYYLTGVGGIILIAKKLHFHCKAIQVIADS